MRNLRTERLVLEPLVETHAAEMFRVLVDPIIYTFLHERPPFTEEELRARYRFLEKRRSPDGCNDWFSWVIRDEQGDGLGFVQAVVYPRRTADLFVVMAPRAWGQGFAREALGGVIRELGTNGGVSSFLRDGVAAQRSRGEALRGAALPPPVARRVRFARRGKWRPHLRAPWVKEPSYELRAMGTANACEACALD